MKIVATSDTHFPFDRSLIPDGDVFIHAGDLMYKGTPDEWEARVQSLKALPHRTKLYIPGNHDYFPYHYRGLARSQLRREAGVTLVDHYDPVQRAQGLTFLCAPFVTGLPGWAYNLEEDQLSDWLALCTDDVETIDVVVSHSPPFRIRDACGKENYGALALNRWFYQQRVPPRAWICGHIHESYGHERVGGCDFYNVAMCNEQYEQTNRALEIEL